MATFAGAVVSDADALRLRGVTNGPWRPTQFRTEAPDEMVDALIWALAEFAGEHDEDRSAFSEAKHPRNPKGTPGGGRFKSIADRVVAALTDHHAGKGDGDPLKDFNREQLRKVAKARGIELKRGASEADIKKALIDHAAPGGKAKPEMPAVVKKATKKTAGDVGAAAPKAMMPAAGRDISNEVDFGSLPDGYNSKTGENDALKAIIAKQGFDGKPKVVSAADFDAAVRSGEVRETWRGVGTIYGGRPPAENAEHYRTGDFHIGLGINGDGTYVAVNKSDAELYGSAMLRIGLRKDAKVVSADDLDKEMDAFFATQQKKTNQLRVLDEKLISDLANAKTPRARANIRRKYRNDVYGMDRDRTLALQRDPGIFAALRGYDAIDIPQARSPDKHAEVIVLNRTATVVQEA